MFQSKLVLGIGVEGRFILMEPLVYTSEVLGYTVTVPAGFDTDGASIPLGINELWKIGGPKMKAAVVHDYFYRNHQVEKSVADRVFLEALESVGVGRIKRSLMYWAVCAFGWSAWRANG